MKSFLERYRGELVIVVATILLFNIATLFLPPNFRGLSFYSALFLFDVVISAAFFFVMKWTGTKRIVFLLFFWAPFVLLCIIVLCAIFFPFPDWNVYIKTISVTLLFSLLAAHVFLSLFVLIAFVLKWIFKEKALNNTFIFTGMAVSLFIFAVCATAPFFWTISPKVVRVEIAAKEVSYAFNDYKIVQLSDLHFDFFANDKLLQKTIDSIQKIKPNVIMITGDVVTYQADEMKPFLPVLERLKAPDGVYCVMGNHDYGTYYRWKTEEERTENDARLLQYFDQLGWKLLRNESDFLIRGRDSIAIAGTENRCFHETHYPCEGDVELALQNISKSCPAIVMTHDPVYWENELRHSKRPLFLTLSGHTHGMQIGYRTKKSYWTLDRVVNKYSSGLYHEKEKYLYINSGLGTVGFPFRIGLNPEITVIQLKCIWKERKNMTAEEWEEYRRWIIW